MFSKTQYWQFWWRSHINYRHQTSFVNNWQPEFHFKEVKAICKQSKDLGKNYSVDKRIKSVITWTNKNSSNFPSIETKTVCVTSDCHTFLLKLMLSEEKVLLSERSDIKMPAREKAKLMMGCHEKKSGSDGKKTNCGAFIHLRMFFLAFVRCYSYHAAVSRKDVSFCGYLVSSHSL